MYASVNWVKIGLDNGLLHIWHQAIILINAGLLSIKSGDFAQFPPQPPGSLVRWGTEWPKFNSVIQGKYFLWTMTSNSLTENEEHDIRSHILKTIFGLHASYFLDPNVCGFQYICRVLWSQILVVNWQH